MDWLTEHGAKMGGVELAADVPLYGYCVKAKSAISAGDLLFSIPLKVMMSTETAMSSEIGIIFLLYILACQNTKSGIKCYIISF